MSSYKDCKAHSYVLKTTKPKNKARRMLERRLQGKEVKIIEELAPTFTNVKNKIFSRPKDAKEDEHFYYFTTNPELRYLGKHRNPFGKLNVRPAREYLGFQIKSPEIKEEKKYITVAEIIQSHEQDREELLQLREAQERLQHIFIREKKRIEQVVISEMENKSNKNEERLTQLTTGQNNLENNFERLDKAQKKIQHDEVAFQENFGYYLKKFARDLEDFREEQTGKNTDYHIVLEALLERIQNLEEVSIPDLKTDLDKINPTIDSLTEEKNVTLGAKKIRVPMEKKGDLDWLISFLIENGRRPNSYKHLFTTLIKLNVYEEDALELVNSTIGSHRYWAWAKQKRVINL